MADEKPLTIPEDNQGLVEKERAIKEAGGRLLERRLAENLTTKNLSADDLRKMARNMSYLLGPPKDVQAFRERLE